MYHSIIYLYIYKHTTSTKCPESVAISP